MSQPADSPEKVSGPTCFWLLIALAGAAITQPSISSSRRPNLLGGPLDPVRCMPLLCLLDAIYDIFTMSLYLQARFARSSRQERQERPAEHPSPSARSMSTVYLFKSALFILGTLYAAVYVFSLQGILITQLCAVCYLFATSTGFVADVFGFKLDGQDSIPVDRQEDGLSMILMSMPVWGHIAFLVAVCLAPYAPLSPLELGCWPFIIALALAKPLKDKKRYSIMSPEGHFFDGCLLISIIPVFYLTYFHNIGGLRWISNVTLTSLVVSFVDFAISSFNEVPWKGIKGGPKRQWVLAACLLTLITAIDYYFFQFNDDGTVKPGWTEVFGKH